MNLVSAQPLEANTQPCCSGSRWTWICRTIIGIATVALNPTNPDRSETTRSSGLGEATQQPAGSWRLAYGPTRPGEGEMELLKLPFWL